MLHHTDISGELDAIKAALKGWPEPTITGGKLDALIRSVAPGIKVREIADIPKGPGALKEFIRRHLADVVERIGSQGADALLRIVGHEAASLPPSVSPQIWRTFVSPNSAQHLVLNRSTRLLFARGAPAVVEADELEIARATLDEHDRMRSDFVKTLPTESRAVLCQAAGSDTDFNAWIAALREQLPETIPAWGNYRRRRLAKLFEERIAELDLDETLRLTALDQIRSAEVLAYAKPTRTNTASKPARREASSRDDVVEVTAHARRLAHAAVDLLAYDDLRSLRIPLGVMLEAIRTEA